MLLLAPIASKTEIKYFLTSFVNLCLQLPRHACYMVPKSGVG